jgi:hypothetical protein
MLGDLLPGPRDRIPRNDPRDRLAPDRMRQRETGAVAPLSGLSAPAVGLSATPVPFHQRSRPHIRNLGQLVSQLIAPLAQLLDGILLKGHLGLL